MKLPMFALAFLAFLTALGACAILTGDPVKDCLSANNTLNAVRTGSIAADAYLVANPTSPRAKQAADLAHASLAAALATQVSVCPAVPKVM